MQTENLPAFRLLPQFWREGLFFQRTVCLRGTHCVYAELIFIYSSNCGNWPWSISEQILHPHHTTHLVLRLVFCRSSLHLHFVTFPHDDKRFLQLYALAFQIMVGNDQYRTLKRKKGIRTIILHSFECDLPHPSLRAFQSFCRPKSHPNSITHLGAQLNSIRQAFHQSE